MKNYKISNKNIINIYKKNPNQNNSANKFQHYNKKNQLYKLLSKTKQPPTNKK